VLESPNIEAYGTIHNSFITLWFGTTA